MKKILFILLTLLFVTVSCKKEENDSEPNPQVNENLVISANGVSFEMIYVEGGTFDMGATSEQGSDDPDPDEYPVHQVTLSNYYIGKYEVTQELWRAVTGNNPSWFTPENGYDNNLKNPVEMVSWDDIVNDFLPALNRLTGKTFALPTEAQWEFAARGGNKSQNYKYSGGNNIDAVAWYSDNSDGQTHPVGQKQDNELGIYDMSGNIWEWCSDWYGEYSPEPQTDPAGPANDSLHVLRGGCWWAKNPWCRVSDRGYYHPNSDNYYGFRLMLLP